MSVFSSGMTRETFLPKRQIRPDGLGIDNNNQCGRVEILPWFSGDYIYDSLSRASCKNHHGIRRANRSNNFSIFSEGGGKEGAQKLDSFWS